MIYACSRKEKPPSNGVDQGPPIVVLYHRGAHAQAFLGAWRGHLMVDDDASYNVAVQPGRHALGQFLIGIPSESVLGQHQQTCVNIVFQTLKIPCTPRIDTR